MMLILISKYTVDVQASKGIGYYRQYLYKDITVTPIHTLGVGGLKTVPEVSAHR